MKGVGGRGQGGGDVEGVREKSQGVRREKRRECGGV